MGSIKTGFDFLIEGAYEEAIKLFELDVNNDPNNYETRFNLATAYLHSGDNKRAIKEYKLLLKVYPKNTDIFVNLAMAYKNKGRIRKAITILKDVITLSLKTEIAPATLALAHTNLGAIYQGKKNFNKAIYEYQKAIEIDPSTPLASQYLKNLEDYLKIVREGRTIKGPNGKVVMIDLD